MVLTFIPKMKEEAKEYVNSHLKFLTKILTNENDLLTNENDYNKIE